MHEALKEPPRSQEAEQSVIGGLVIYNAAYDLIADRLCETDFYEGRHRLLFRAISALASRGDPFDIITISDALERRGQLEDAGGMAYIGTLAKTTPSAANIVAYAKIVRDMAMLRGLITASCEIGAMGYSVEGAPQEKLDKAQQLVMALADNSLRSEPRLAGALLPKVLEDIDQRGQLNGQMVGLETGFIDLDRLTCGFQAGDMVVLAGRPSMGKTAFALNVVEHVAVHRKEPALIFSLEMTAEQLVSRSIASLGKLDFQKIRTGKLDAEEWSTVTKTASKIGAARLLIDDAPALSVMEIRARARRVKREHGLSLVVVDYLQLMSGEGENETHRIGQISHALKALAKELAIPVVVLSQLNRSLETRQNKRPMMSDLRQSGDIEQDADVIIFLYRDEVYDEYSPAKGTAEVIIGKQRNGPTGVVRLTFQGEYCRFDNYFGPAISNVTVIKKFRGGFNAGAD